MRIPKGQSKNDNPEKLTTRQRKTKQNKNTIQYVLDTTIQKQNKNTIQYVLDTTIQKQT